MKRKAKIATAMVILMAILLVLIRYLGLDPSPVLVYKGYDKEIALDHARIFKFDFSNTTKVPIWFYSGTPISSLVEPGEPRPPDILSNATEGFIRPRKGQVIKLRPRETLSLGWVVLDTQPPLRPGVIYYVGNFKDEADFHQRCLMWPPAQDAPWKDKITYYWKKYGFYHRRHVLLSAENFTVKTKNPEEKAK